MLLLKLCSLNFQNIFLVYNAIMLIHLLGYSVKIGHEYDQGLIFYLPFICLLFALIIYLPFFVTSVKNKDLGSI